jgi:tetrahydromethanopterin S-methyltransferase subunit G
MSAYCTIEESCNVLLPNGGGLSDGISPIRNRKQPRDNKKHNNKNKVPSAYHYNANQSYCSFGTEDTNKQTMSGLVNPVPTNPPYYNENIIDDEYHTQQQLGKHTGHQPKVYSEFKEVDVKESHSDVAPINNDNNNNNKVLSDILKRIERLETRMNQNASPKAKSNIHDIILYIVVGVFLLFILDSMFKIGKLTSN